VVFRVLGIHIFVDAVSARLGRVISGMVLSTVIVRILLSFLLFLFHLFYGLLPRVGVTATFVLTVFESDVMAALAAALLALTVLGADRNVRVFVRMGNVFLVVLIGLRCIAPFHRDLVVVSRVRLLSLRIVEAGDLSLEAFGLAPETSGFGLDHCLCFGVRHDRRFEGFLLHRLREPLWEFVTADVYERGYEFLEADVSHHVPYVVEFDMFVLGDEVLVELVDLLIGQPLVQNVESFQVNDFLPAFSVVLDVADDLLYGGHQWAEQHSGRTLESVQREVAIAA